MEINIPEGAVLVLEKTVAPEDTAARYGSGLIEVFATPALMGLMERTAQQSVQQFLPAGYITLGIEINVRHIKATPVGMKVRCESKLVRSEGKKLFFELRAFDEVAEIGSATHTRYIVNGDEFMKKFQK